jgi:hypothetical protein
MIVLLTIVAVATPVMAEDRLSLAGQMRVRGWHIDDGGDTTESFADQRLRIGGKLSVAEGVTVIFRTDLTEKSWGDGGNTFGAGRLPQDGMQVDRAHLDLAAGNLHFRAGQQYIAFGNSGFDAQDAGLTLNVMGPIPVTAFWMLADDNDVAGSAAGFAINQSTGAIEPVAAVDANTKSDAFYYGARVAHKGGSYASQLFVAGQQDVNNGDESVQVVGLTLDLDLAPVKLYGEAEFFTGDADANVDAVGTQVMLDASMAATEIVTVGGQIFYAMGTDKADEQQYVVLGNDFGGWDPLFALGTGLNNEQIGAGRPYDLFGGSNGVMAGRLYTSIKATDAATVGLSVAYAEPDEDIAGLDSAMALAAGLNYTVMANTKLGLQLEYIDIDDDADTDEIFNAGVGLFVNF